MAPDCIWSTCFCTFYDPTPKEPDEPWLLDEVTWQRERMQEHIVAFDMLCRTILRSFVNMQTPIRVILQPCWSSRRWKSLT